MDEALNYDLPRFNEVDWKIDAIKCDEMTLYYEGLENIRRLNHLKFMSFINVKDFDDWSLDRVCGSEFPLLQVLDLTGTNITSNGLAAIHKVPSLRLLILNDIKRSTEFELACLQIEVVMPKLKIQDSSEVHITPAEE